MVKFTLHITTPFEEYNRTYYARSANVATYLYTKWNEELKGTGRSLKMIGIKKTTEKLPAHYTCW